MDRVMEGLTELADFLAARHNEDPGSKHLQSVKRAEIEIERLRALSPVKVEGPSVKALETANCCHCGRIIDTREKSEGGDDFGAQLTDKRWTCSFACWEAVVDPDTLVEQVTDETAERGEK